MDALSFALLRDFSVPRTRKPVWVLQTTVEQTVQIVGTHVHFLFANQYSYSVTMSLPKAT